QYGEFGIEDYLSDGVIHLTMERSGDQINRKIAIVKMRHTSHTLGYYPWRWDSSMCKFTVH
ncbi:MAG: ATPase domain-containing protein, partial [Candidatus Thalassarchaeaceae archaeon]|nr:ATPase domain-containing protein [Candidatus Thalassarchaeaceae archaeon]